MEALVVLIFKDCIYLPHSTSASLSLSLYLCLSVCVVYRYTCEARGQLVGGSLWIRGTGVKLVVTGGGWRTRWGVDMALSLIATFFLVLILL